MDMRRERPVGIKLYRGVGQLRATLLAVSGLILGGCAGLPGTNVAVYEGLAPTDVSMAAAAMQDALETGAQGSQAGWQNAQTGNRGQFEIGETYVDDDGAFCRQYTETIILADGRSGKVDNRACRSDAGQWLWI